MDGRVQRDGGGEGSTNELTVQIKGGTGRGVSYVEKPTECVSANWLLVPTVCQLMFPR